MPVYRDIDRLGAQIKNDVLSLIRRDSINAVNEVASKLNDVIESTEASSELKTSRTEKGAMIRAEVDVPIDNASSFVLGADNAVKSTFRFGKWSDMKVS